MKFSKAGILLLCIGWAFSAPFALAYQVRDASGKIFEFAKPPRAATIVPAITQNIYAVGAEKYLVGNSRYCNIPEDAKKKVKLGGFVDPDYEKIVSLNPEIFILPTLSDSRIPDRLEKFGIRVFTLHGEGLKNISADLRMLGELFDCKKNAEIQARRIEAEIAAAPQSGEDSKRALFMFGNIAAAKGSYVGELMRLCGLINCAESSQSAWATLSREFIFAARPQVVFVEFGNIKERENILNFYKTDAIWKNTPAVRENKIFFIPRDVVGVPSIRAVEALKMMRNCLKN